MWTFYIDVQPYLAQWATKHFGNPVEFPRESPESKLIKRWVEHQPKDAPPQLSGNLQIKIPITKEKDPRAGYFYMPPRALSLVRESLETLFVQNLWTELGDAQRYNCELTTLIYAWLEKHGIDDHYWECIRQKYYRLRKLYAEKGVKLAEN